MTAPLRDSPPPEVPRSLVVMAAYSWRFLVISAAVVVLVYVLVVLRLIVIPVFVALMLSTLLVPLAERLRRRGVPALVATWLVFVGALGTLGGLIFLLAPQVSDQLGNVGREVRAGTESVVTWLIEGPLDLSRGDVDRYLDQVTEQLRERQGSLVSGAFRGAYLVAELIAGILLVLVLVFFFIKDGDRISNGIVGLFPSERHRDIRALGRRSWEALGAYIRGTAVVGLVNATAIGVALLIIGVPLVLPLAIITFLGAFFPLIGAVLAGSIAALVALVTQGVVPALIVVAVTVAVQQVEGDVVQPLVLGRAVKLHPLVILLALTGGAVVAGIAGAFLAVPVAAIVSACVDYLRSPVLSS